MELSKQVCSLELAQKIKELGFEQDSLFWWGYEGRFDNARFVRICTDLSHWDNENMIEECAAFTVAELGEMLPWQIIVKNKPPLYLEYLKLTNAVDEFSVRYGRNYEYFIELGANTEADARAKMLIYLKENSLI